MINIAVLDDELKFIYDYENKIPEILKKNNIEGGLILATNSTSKFLDAVKSNKVNLCILDIDLKSNITGMNIANELRKEDYPCDIIFMTGHYEYIKEAFDVQAFNFIQKPGWDELERNILKLSNEDLKRNSKRTVGIKCGFDVIFINFDTILCIEHIGTKTTIHTTTGRYDTYEGLEDLINRISDKRFIRCHRSVFININYLQKIDIKNREIILTDGSQYKIGPKYYPLFQAWREL